MNLHITHISPSHVNDKVVSGPEKIVSKNKQMEPELIRHLIRNSKIYTDKDLYQTHIDGQLK